MRRVFKMAKKSHPARCLLRTKLVQELGKARGLPQMLSFMFQIIFSFHCGASPPPRPYASSKTLMDGLYFNDFLLSLDMHNL